MKFPFFLLTLVLVTLPLFTQAQNKNHVFSIGQKGSSTYFTGNVWNHPLIENDSILTILGGEVYFEPGARSNWHSHPAGQILVVTAGVGYHQIEGEHIQIIKKGETIKCPPNTNHWHGASKNKSMSHIYLLPNTEKGIVNWGSSVTDEEYNTIE